MHTAFCEEYYRKPWSFCLKRPLPHVQSAKLETKEQSDMILIIQFRKPKAFGESFSTWPFDIRRHCMYALVFIYHISIIYKQDKVNNANSAFIFLINLLIEFLKRAVSRKYSKMIC